MTRRRWNVSDTCSLRSHDHVAWFGDGDDELYSVAIAAFADGARRHEKLLFVADDPDPARLCGDGLERLLEAGQLELLALDAVYGGSGTFSAADQLATFKGVLAGALADGYRGIRVVADNTSLVCGHEEGFRHWLAWEQLTDSFQAQSPVTGICFFDQRALDHERRLDLAALHPVRSDGGAQPPFSLFSEGGAVSVTGRVDSSCANQFQRLLQATPGDRPLALDVSAARFRDQDAVIALAESASAGRPIEVRGDGHLRTLLDELGIAAPHLQFEPAVHALRRCSRCGDVIGLYEPILVVANGVPRATSIAAEPEALAGSPERYHRACSPEG